jgi:hypothetical protein
MIFEWEQDQNTSHYKLINTSNYNEKTFLIAATLIRKGVPLSISLSSLDTILLSRFRSSSGNRAIVIVIFSMCVNPSRMKRI